MANYPIANIGVGTAFAKDVNHIASVRTQLKNALTGIIHTDEEAVIERVTMKSATTFSVQFYGNVTITAQLVDSEYVLEYKGIIDRIVFKDNNTTLTFFQVGWSQMKSCHIQVGISTTPSTTFAINNPAGAPLVADANGKFDLISGTGYVVKTDATADYDADKFYVTPDYAGDINLKLDDVKKYNIVFVLSPSTATVVVNDYQGNVVTPLSKGKYLLKDSTVAGNYSYTVTKDKYITAAGTIDAQQDATISVTLKQLSSIAITTAPTKTAYSIGETFDPAGMIVTATYSDGSTAAVTGYTYPTTALTLEDTSVTISYTVGGTTKTTEQVITVTVPNYLCFTNNSATNSATFKWKINGTLTTTPTVSYSTDYITWTTYTFGTDITIPASEEIYWKGNNNSWGENYSKYIKAVMTGSISASGSVMSLISGKDESEIIPCDYCFANLFNGCRALTASPELPATTLTSSCYQYMFAGTSLVTPPELPATTMYSYCYANMFQGCNELTEGPEIPAMVLASGCYQYMFANCTSLTEAPELPATTLVDSSYRAMFFGCTGLTEAPELPATTLASGCYKDMFYGCTGLTEAPELPVITLASGCYLEMFYGCTGLAEAPELPATTLEDSCYNGMFYGCTGLTEAPELPAITLASNCYSGMFKNCTGLTTVPELPARIEATYCYKEMFSGCTNIKVSTTQDETYQYEWRLPAWGTGTSASSWTNNMLMGTGGTFVSNPEINTVYYTDHQPISEPNKQYLCFTNNSNTETATVKWTVNGITTVPEFGYSTDKSLWTIYEFGTDITIPASEKLYWKGANKDWGGNSSKYIQAVMTGSISASGSVMSLYDGVGKQKSFSYSAGLTKFFKDCTSLTTAPELPATTLKPSCYEDMFYGCTGLTEAPELPATTLASGCYEAMFYGCTGLAEAPELPATTLEDSCYNGMFCGCTGLTEAPELPAITLASSCYSGMFKNCTGLTEAPELSSNALAEHCYSTMFSGCSSLTEAPALPALTLPNECYYNMFANCTSLTEAPELPATTLGQSCCGSMFWGCTSLTTMPKLPATVMKNACYQNMFYRCTNIKVSTTQDATYQYEWRIPTSGTGTADTNWNKNMFYNTGGTFTSDPTINTTYYTDHEPV